MDNEKERIEYQVENSNDEIKITEVCQAEKCLIGLNL